MCSATVSQIRSLLKHVPALIRWTIDEEMALKEWVRHRKQQAMLSHRKTTLKKLALIGVVIN